MILVHAMRRLTTLDCDCGVIVINSLIWISESSVNDDSEVCAELVGVQFISRKSRIDLSMGLQEQTSLRQWLRVGRGGRTQIMLVNVYEAPLQTLQTNMDPARRVYRVLKLEGRYLPGV